MRLVFMGTPRFAVPSLEILYKNGYDIAAVVTAPDKPAGRGKQLSSSPVKQFALQHQLPILQPTNLKSEEFLSELRALAPEIIVVVAFRMLPEVVWSFPPQGTINLHASLLPDYRGAAPINWTLINGETHTGVTTFFIEKEIDTGKLLLQKSIDIDPTWNAGMLHDLLMIIGAELLLETLQAIEQKTIISVPQDPSKAVHKAPKLTPENTRISWEQSPQSIHNFIRGLAPEPAAWTTIHNQKLKILLAQPTELIENQLPVGSLLTKNKKLYAVCKDHQLLQILSLQLEGKKAVSGTDFVNGYFKNIQTCLMI